MAWFLPALIGGVGSILSARTARKNAKRQAEAQERIAQAQSEGQRLDLGRLRAEAAEHGFNPLTVLGATGGAGFHQGYVAQATPGFLSDPWGGIANAVNMAFEAKRQKDNDALAGALMKAQTNNLNANTALMMQPRRTSAGSIPSSKKQGDFVRFEDQPFVPVYDAVGNPFEIRQGIADRLGLKAGDVWIAEDAEAIYGDVSQELEGLTTIYQNVKDAFFGGGSEIARPGHRSVTVNGGNVVIPPPPLSVNPPTDVSAPIMREKPTSGWMDEKFQ